MTNETNEKIFAKRGTKYLSKILKEGLLPKGILNKNRTGCGGTTTAIECKVDYIIFVPTIEIIKNKLNQYPNADTGNQIFIIPVYAKISDDDIRVCISDAREEGRLIKIMATYNSAERLRRIEEVNLFGIRVLVDEFHDLMVSYSFKGKTIEKFLGILASHEYVTYMSATPLNDKTCPVQLRNLKYTEIEWEEKIIQVVERKQSARPYATLRKYLNYVCFGHALALAKCSQSGEEIIPDEYFIYLNNVTQIANILKNLPWTTKNEIRVVCTDNPGNRNHLGDFADCLGSISENRKFNFLTRRGFYGCDVYSKKGITIIATNTWNDSTLLDVEIDIKQILGRIRDENNPFKNSVIHIFNDCLTNENNDRLESIRREQNDMSLTENKRIYAGYRLSIFEQQYQNEIQLKAAYEKSGIEVKESFIRFNLYELDKIDSCNRFEDNLKEYCSLTADGQFDFLSLPKNLREFYNPFVAKAIKTLGRPKLKALSYERKKIEQELSFLDKSKQVEISTKLGQTIEVGARFTNSEIKNLLQRIFHETGINKIAKAIDINLYYDTNVVNVTLNGKRGKGYRIIAKK